MEESPWRLVIDTDAGTGFKQTTCLKILWSYPDFSWPHWKFIDYDYLSDTMSPVANASSLIRIIILKNSIHKQNNHIHDDDMEKYSLILARFRGIYQ